jgi:hypothetical protein
MSLAEEVRTLQQRVAARLAELEPLVREYEELRQLAAELGIAGAAPPSLGTAASLEGPERPTASADTPSPPAAPARRRGARRGQSRAADAGDIERDARVLEAVRDHPGATVAEIAAIVGVEATSLYRPVRELTTTGALVKRGHGLFPADGS